jgi:hypothetical protein
MKQKYKTSFQNHQANFKCNHAFLLFVVTLVSFFSEPTFANSQEVNAAIALLKNAYPEQCQKNKLKVQLLIAHRNHDQLLLEKLGSKLDAINTILKPTEDKLNALKAEINKNPDDTSDFENALLNLGGCE